MAAAFVGSKSGPFCDQDGSPYKIPNDPRRALISYADKWEDWAYKTPDDVSEVSTIFKEFESNPEWTRCDDTFSKRNGNPNISSSHAIVGSLGVRAGAIKSYRMYLKNDGSEIAMVVNFGHGVAGHPGILHGGVTGLLFDEAMVRRI